MIHGASLSSFSFLFSLLITSKKLKSHQHMLLTWLLPRSPYVLSSADPTSWIMIYGSRIRDRTGGSSMADSVSCWHLIMVVNHDRGGSWWWILMAAVNNDIWWHLILMVVVAADHRIWLQQDCFPSDTQPLLTIIHQFSLSFLRSFTLLKVFFNQPYLNLITWAHAPYLPQHYS